MVRAVERTLDILETLAGAGGDVSVSRLQGEVGLPLGTLHRQLGTLVRRGYATQDPVTRLYGVGPKLLEVAARAADSGRFDLRRIARPRLRALTEATGETSNLALISDGESVYVEQAPSPRLVRALGEVGRRAPLYCTGRGKAILSAYPEERLEAYLAMERLEPKTEHTITSPDALRAEIALVRERGYAVDDGEREADVRCVAAPVFDGTGACVGAISVSGPATRLSWAAIPEIGERVRRVADECSGQLGYLPGPEIGGGRSIDGSYVETTVRRRA
jgi:DNA-binding IclR family transcriptional regulator